MPLMSTSSQPGQIPGTSTKIAAQREPVQKPASRMEKSEQAADKDFESLLEKEQPQNKETAEAKPSEKTEKGNAETEKPTETNNSEKTQQPENSDKTEENSTEENQEQISEFSDFVEAQANWKPEGNPAPQVSEATAQTVTIINKPLAEEAETAKQAVAVINKSLAEEAQKALQQLTQDAVNNTSTARSSQTPAGLNSSLLVQKIAQESENPEQFKQDSLSEHIDPEDGLPANVKTESQGTKTNLDIQQLFARLNTAQISGSTETTPSAYSQVAAVSAQNAQISTAATGQAQAAPAQARPEAQPALSLFNDPEWPEGLGQRLFRLSQGENGMKEVSLRLDPPSLGTLDIKLKIDDNNLSVQFQSASPQVRELLHNQADRLRASLNDANMNLVDVDVSSGQDSGRHHSHGQADTLLQGTAIAMSTHNSETEGNSPDQDSQGKNSSDSSALHSSNLYLSTYA